MSQPPFGPLTLAIDFDGTWTADPHAWLAWYELMTSRGHTVLLVTGRDGWSEDMARSGLPAGMEIIYCGRDLKESVVRRTGRVVNIWIDDMPGMIQECRILGGAL